MKSIKETVSSFAIRQALNYARKDPDKNLMNLLNLFEKADIKKVNRVTSCLTWIPACSTNSSLFS